MNYYPNLSYDFVGATGEHVLKDYIDITSNILNNKINITSNILNTKINYTSNVLNTKIDYTSNVLNTKIDVTSNILETRSSNYTNALRYDVNKWIGEEIEHVSLPTPNDKVHTYIYNSNILGEIRFVTKGTPDYIFNDHNKYTIKIKENGRLAIYYEYDIGYPTVVRGWYDIMDSIRDAYAYQGTNGIVIGEVQIAINTLNSQTDRQTDRQLALLTTQ